MHVNGRRTARGSGNGLEKALICGEKREGGGSEIMESMQLETLEMGWRKRNTGMVDERGDDVAATTLSHCAGFNDK